MSKILITRFGGIGDVAPVSAAAYQLYKQGHEVTLALRADGLLKQTDLLVNQDWCKLLDYKQIGPWGTRCVPYKHGWVQIEKIYPEFDQVIDMMYSIEGNSTCKSSMEKKATDCWMRSRNSNWINWYDLNLMWVNIDPTKVPDDGKRPHFKLSKKEREISDGLKKKWPNLFVLNPTASSLARTWYQAKDLIPLIMNKYEDALIAVWNPQEYDWVFHSKNGPENIKVDVKSGLRKSLTLLDACKLYIGVDTGLSHMAEGLGKKHIAIYSTVPWWTRAKYYKHQTHIDMGEKDPSLYTFSLTAGDPLNMDEGQEGLSKREKKLFELQKAKVPIIEACKELNTDRVGLNLEFEALQKKFQSFERLQSKALSMVTPQMVFEKVEELCE